MATEGTSPKQAKFALPSFKLWHDFGVSALLVTLTTSTTMFVAIWGLMNGKIDQSKEVIGILSVLTTTFWNGYLTKRKEEQE